MHIWAASKIEGVSVGDVAAEAVGAVNVGMGAVVEGMVVRVTEVAPVTMLVVGYEDVEIPGVW